MTEATETETVQERVTRLTDGPEFGELSSRDEYAAYFNHLAWVFNVLGNFYRQHVKATHEKLEIEPQAIQSLLARLLYTVRVLRMKYAYNPNHWLRIDLTASGFPNSLEIEHLNTELNCRAQILQGLPPGKFLKGRMLDTMLLEHREPTEWLEQMGQRTYLEMLEAEKLFLRFTPGQLTCTGQSKKLRHYVFCWGCYDLVANLPYLHIMAFDQDSRVDPLEPGSPTYTEFLEAVAAEGSRAPEVGIVAIGIDSRIDAIHPKILKRLCIGPLYSPLLLTHQAEANDPYLTSLRHCLELPGMRPQDFILYMTDEIVFSDRQVVTEKGWLHDTVREVFFIPEADLDCYHRKASMVHRNLLMPHGLLQHLMGNGGEHIQDFALSEKICYDTKGGIYVVQ